MIPAKTPLLIVQKDLNCIYKVMDSPTATLIQILRERVDSLLADGNYDEAVHAATAAVEKAQQALSEDLESIDEFACTLEVRGELYRNLGRLEEARLPTDRRRRLRRGRPEVRGDHPGPWRGRADDHRDADEEHPESGEAAVTGRATFQVAASGRAQD